MTETSPPVIIPSPLARWFLAFREDVLSGRVSLEELIEVTGRDMQQEMPELCPVCARYPVRPGSKAGAHGVCAVCWLYRLKEKHVEKLAELEMLREYNAAKKQLQRLRDSMGVMPEKALKRRDYGNRIVIDPASMRATDICETCGRRFYSRNGEHDCPACIEQRERRETAAAERAARNTGGGDA